MTDLVPDDADGTVDYASIRADVVALLETARRDAARSVNALATELEQHVMDWFAGLLGLLAVAGGVDEFSEVYLQALARHEARRAIEPAMELARYEEVPAHVAGRVQAVA